MKSIASIPGIALLFFTLFSCSSGQKDATHSGASANYDTIKTDSGITIIKDKAGNIVQKVPTSQLAQLTHGGSTPLADNPLQKLPEDTFKGQEYPYYIEGSLIHGEGGNITLDRLGIGNDIHPIFVEAVNSEGRFGFEGMCSQPQLMQLRLPDGNIQFVVKPKDTIDFSIVLEDAKDYKVKGSPESLQLEHIFNILNEANAKKYEIDDRLKAAEKNNILYRKIFADRPEEYHRIDREKRKNIKDYITTLDSSFVCILASLYLDPVEDYDFMKKLDAKFANIYPHNVFYKALDEKVSIYKPVDMGMIAPEIISETPEGQSIHLSSLKGKYVFLDFWASYVDQSRTNHPAMRKAYDKYHKKGFEIVSYTIDKDKNLWKQAITDDRMNWINISDLLGYQSAGPATYIITNVPFNFLLDKDGRIIGKNLTMAELNKKLAQLLK